MKLETVKRDRISDLRLREEREEREEREIKYSTEEVRNNRNR
tara:strand:+ start:293 stop:418 length:126 start_codon:yes stop_codon:yes gene_type:complete